MSWAQLQQALQQIHPVGTNGFEGIVATLLGNLLGEPFTVAGGGPQSGLDARNQSGTTAMQAKRYSAAALTVAKLETDFHNTRRDLAGLEVYVVAITKSIAQFQTRLEILRQETGIDLIALDWKG